MSPGWVSTDIGGPYAPTTPEEGEWLKIFVFIALVLLSGALLPVFAATIPPDQTEFNGKLIDSNHEELTWKRIRTNMINFGKIYEEAISKL